MATLSICEGLITDRDYACDRDFVSGFFQEVVLIKLSNIANYVRAGAVAGQAGCNYVINTLVLKEGEGIRIKAPGSSTLIKGTVSKSTDDNGFVKYNHKVTVMAAGITKEDMCNLDTLDRNLWGAVLQATDGTVIVYGISNGLTTTDYDYDITGSNGVLALTLESKENKLESYLPTPYFNTDDAQTEEDFRAKFATA